MNYQDVIKDSKFYLPMNLNLGYLLKDTEIVMLMNVINCDNIHEKLSVRKLMRYTNRSNNTVQNALKTLRNLKLIDGFTPNYENLKYVFDSINNSKSIEERIKWCKNYITVSENDTKQLYQNSIQNSVSETGTENVSKTGTQIKKMYKEDEKKEDVLNKKDLNIYKECNTLVKNESRTSTTVSNFFEDFKENVNKKLIGNDENELLEKRVELSSELIRNRIQIGTNMYTRCTTYLNRKYDEVVASM